MPTAHPHPPLPCAQARGQGSMHDGGAIRLPAHGAGRPLPWIMSRLPSPNTDESGLAAWHAIT
eukprot:9296112-Prorocentrum_lima.AAC.1